MVSIQVFADGWTGPLPKAVIRQKWEVAGAVGIRQLYTGPDEPLLDLPPAQPPQRTDPTT
jgi:hypothetical protein